MTTTETLVCPSSGETEQGSDKDAALRAYIATLSPKDARIMKRRWGLGRDAMSIVEIADELGLRVAHVGQRASAIAKAHARTMAKPALIVAAKKPKRITSDDAKIEICGMSITRHGDDAYRIDGRGPISSDQVGEILRQRVDENGHKNALAILGRYDRWLANGYRGARAGTRWPHPSNCTVRLRIIRDATHDA